MFKVSNNLLQEKPSSSALKWNKQSETRDQSVSSVTQSCPTLCNSMDCNTPGFPVNHQLPEPTQTHVLHRFGDAINHFNLYDPLLPP